MANEQRLEQLREEGVEAWNAWRDSAGSVLSEEDLDLSGADLRESDLAGAHFIDVDFTNSDLRGADLTNADLRGANLIGADLIGADLTNADIRGANLIGADLIGADLTNADIRGANLISADLTNADIRGADLRGADLSDADLTNADIRGANLMAADISGATLVNADFSGVNLSMTTLMNVEYPDVALSNAKFIDANLSGQDLTNAKLTKTDLTNASLIEANLMDADLATAKIIGVDFTRATLKDAILFPEASFPPSYRPIGEGIESVSDLLNRVHYIKARYTGPAPVLYFRGEVQSNWDLMPSVYRDELGEIARHEGKRLRDLISRRPSEFSGVNSALTQWMLAQHHGLKTRFLDITKNPLVGLFFACGGYRQGETDKGETDSGRLRVFAVRKPLAEKLIKQYDSDAVSLIANFARLAYEDKSVLMNGVRSMDEPSSFSEAKERLLQGVKAEKPYFTDRIDLRDLYRVFIIEPQQLFERIRVQNGAFLVSAFHKRFETREAQREIRNLPIYDEYELSVPKDRKEGMLRELSSLGITRETLFPGLDESARAINDEPYS